MTSPDRLDGLNLRRGVRGLHQGANDGTTGQRDLERIMPMRLRALEHEIRGAAKRIAVRQLAAQLRFRGLVTPRLVGDTAERQPDLADASAIELECRCDR